MPLVALEDEEEEKIARTTGRFHIIHYTVASVVLVFMIIVCTKFHG